MELKLIAVFVIIVIGFAVFAANLPREEQKGEHSRVETSEELFTFSSFQEIKVYLNANSQASYREEYNDMNGTSANSEVKLSVVPEADGDGSSDHSTTNVQVEGVDEGDIVKNDGKYAYVVSRNKTEVYILDVYPADHAKQIAKIESDWSINEIYLNGDKLVILGANNMRYYGYYENGYQYSRYSYTFVSVYDISTKNNPVLDRSEQLNGSYVSSRMIGDHFYVIVNQPSWDVKHERDLPAPPSRIHYINNTTDNYYYFTNIASINVQIKNTDLQNMVLLMGSSNQIYVSTKNIYITCQRNNPYRYSQLDVMGGPYTEQTLVLRISISKGTIKYQTCGTVPGRVLNRFSMDEYDEHFRIATTTGHVSRYEEGTSTNHVFVLDMDMVIVGKVSGIAPGERIYSARFMGKRCYIVTFKKVDPFFVIDVSNPRRPTILGELKIPGYSNYLHPYDENHVIGIGKHTVEAEEGGFAWYQGVKLSLFDVTDVRNPKELSKYIIGDRGTNSEALNDPHAFLFSKSKNLLVIPIQLAKVDESEYHGGSPPPNAYGEYIWNGAYVFDITTSSGIQLNGRITHIDESAEPGSDKYYGYGHYSKNIRRSFYIDETLYTISDYMLKANNLNNLNEINALEFE